jgi:hypothetical protein
MTHTPPPWTFAGDGIYSPGGELIATVAQLHCPVLNVAGGSRLHEIGDNARLLAAAPELAASLLMVVLDKTVRASLRTDQSITIRAALQKAGLPWKP